MNTGNLCHAACRTLRWSSFETAKIEGKDGKAQPQVLPAAQDNPVGTCAACLREETTIRLFDTLGQQVATVYEGTPQAGEEQTARIDVSGLSSGTYFLRMDADGQTQTRRLTVVR